MTMPVTITGGLRRRIGCSVGASGDDASGGTTETGPSCTIGGGAAAGAGAAGLNSAAGAVADAGLAEIGGDVHWPASHTRSPLQSVSFEHWACPHVAWPRTAAAATTARTRLRMWGSLSIHTGTMQGTDERRADLERWW